MKTLKALSVITLFLLQISSYAQSTQPETPPAMSPPVNEQIEQGLKQLSEIIDLYFEHMISLKSTLAINGLKITSPKSKMSEEVASAVDSLDNDRSQIVETLRGFRATIDSQQSSPEIYDNLKFLYDVILIKSFLPRYDTTKMSIFTRLFSSYQPQYVDELIPRTEALNLFFTEFDTNESTKNSLNSNYRVSELIKTHNAITSKINQLRNSNLYQTYPTNVKLESGIQEASFYKSLIKGEEFQHQDVASQLVVNKVADDHFTITLTCANLFNL